VWHGACVCGPSLFRHWLSYAVTIRAYSSLSFSESPVYRVILCVPLCGTASPSHTEFWFVVCTTAWSSVEGPVVILVRYQIDMLHGAKAFKGSSVPCRAFELLLCLNALALSLPSVAGCC